MALTSVDQLLASMTTARQKFPIAKAGIGNTFAGASVSYWRSAGFPAPATTTPVNPVVCDVTTLGGLTYTLPQAGNSIYIARLLLAAATAGGCEIHDRLAHMGGLSAAILTTQTVGVDLNALGGTSNIAQRKGRSDYGSVQWWLECYTNTGSTAAVVTVNYTNHLGVAATTTVSIPVNWRAGVMIPVVPVPGDNIRSIESVTLATSTGTAGLFGITATIQRTEISTPAINIGVLYDWTQTGLPPIYDNSCLFFIGNATTTNVGALNGALTLVQG